MSETKERLARLRARMRDLRLDALVVPRADQYLGEYLPPENERLRWATGFTGSAGVAIVLADRAAIFVDGRYTEQVRQQVDAACFEILHYVETPHLPWLAEQLSNGARVGFDARCHDLAWARTAGTCFEAQGIALVDTEENLVDACWMDRPAAAVQPAILLEERFTGQGSCEKRAQIAGTLGEAKADAALIFAADSVAWLLNIRGRDIPSLPLVLGFALLHADGRVELFTNPQKIPGGFADHVGEGVSVHPEEAAAERFAALAGLTVTLDPNTANAWCERALAHAGAKVVEADDPVIMPKACKNEVEVQGMRDAHVRDGVAEVEFLAWLDAEVAAGRLHSEGAVSDRLFECRAKQALFQETSFSTISAAGANAALPHYNHAHAPVETKLSMNSVYLVDSGGQYLDGTTDITRTVAIGDPGPEVRARFTLVLKGHIALDAVRFPDGTTGIQLDVLARQFLWQAGLDYDHGTGHGVGAFLSVHEGPQRIGKAGNQVPLKPGMVVSNEPGYYRAGHYGMRCENLVVVRPCEDKAGDDRTMYRFEPLTMAPFDLRLVEPALMTPAEIEWLNDYHARVWRTLAPHVEGETRAWLEQATRAVGQGELAA